MSGLSIARVIPIAKSTDLDWAWLAGIFEGEGCIGFTARSSVSLSLTSTDKDVVDRCLEVTGVGTVIEQKRQDRKRHKRCWRWTIQKSDDVEVVISRIEDQLGLRRWAKAQEAKERLKSVRRFGFCKRGHPMSGDNLRLGKNGKTSCRQCNRDRARNNYSYKPVVKGTTMTCSCGNEFIAMSPTHKHCDECSPWARRGKVRS